MLREIEAISENKPVIEHNSLLPRKLPLLFMETLPSNVGLPRGSACTVLRFIVKSSSVDSGRVNSCNRHW